MLAEVSGWSQGGGCSTCGLSSTCWSRKVGTGRRRLHAGRSSGSSGRGNVDRLQLSLCSGSLRRCLLRCSLLRRLQIELPRHVEQPLLSAASAFDELLEPRLGVEVLGLAMDDVMDVFEHEVRPPPRADNGPLACGAVVRKRSNSKTNGKSKWEVTVFRTH